MNDDEVRDLLARWQSGDQQAATALFQRYATRLTGLARSRLPSRMTGRIDPEDVVQSVYRAFFADAKAGRYELERGGDLWQLLVLITFHKLQSQIRRLNSQKRDVERECAFGSEDSLFLVQPQVLARDPSPVDAVALTDLLEKLMHQLEPDERRMLELRLQGYNLQEIAEETHLSQRTVCRALDEVKRLLKSWSAEDAT